MRQCGLPCNYSLQGSPPRPARRPRAQHDRRRDRRPPNHRLPTGTQRLLTTHRDLPTLHLSLDSSPGDLGGTPGGTLLTGPATLFWSRFGCTGLVGGIPFSAKFTRLARPPVPDRPTLHDTSSLPSSMSSPSRPVIRRPENAYPAPIPAQDLPSLPDLPSAQPMSYRPTLQATAGAEVSTSPSASPSSGVRDGKSGRRTAYPQRIVATRPLYRLQDRFAQLSRLQRI